MKKIIYTFLCMLMFSTTSCSDFLNVSSPSSVDEDFVFSSPSEAYKVLIGCYEVFRSKSFVHSNGLFYDLCVVGSDSECHPETYTAQARHVPEGLYATEMTIDYASSKQAWEYLYQMANRLAIVISQIESKPDFQVAWNEQKVSEWTQLYGEAVTLRAIAYHELIRFFGDVPYFTQPIYTEDQADNAACVSRFVIYDDLLEGLKKVEPYMFRMGENGINAERITRSFVQGFIGRVALYAGGYSLCRTDFNYGDITLEQLGTERWGAKYARLTDYKKYYETAKEYLAACVANPGNAKLITNDDRGYGNPFQRNFQYQMDLQVSPESLFEISETQTVQSERPYAFGRPSGGGGGPAYPCKAYGQSRMYASFYYEDYDNADLRRDVTVTVTGNSGNCEEKILSFEPAGQLKGGLSNNKWDESRMSNPYTTKQRMSGINTVYLRMADVILMLAEAYAELNDEGSAKAELAKVRNRAFAPADQTAKVTNYINVLSGNTLKEAIAQERKLEFAGEGLRRYDLIRTGKLPQKIKEIRDKQTAMVNGLKTNGYYKFANDNFISNYIWIKAVNTADYDMNYMLTKQCDVSEVDPAYSIKYPSWRGQHDGWSQFSNASGTRNLSIKGLFSYIAPNSSEAQALEASGYTKTNWGIDIVNNADDYTINVFKGYSDEYLNAGVPPRYLVPMTSETISKSNGLITNGYGFAQE
ncbi:RagB/SusD family nutrient uptake outer membrane protein [termite gut metagenome]|uniref:RagB/SusD family nutrient uptake outer membrane protein n=1 Tax=termite gut metagenome TaxID=433724 RepID=A0A5J4SP48_9ZZZZ